MDKKKKTTKAGDFLRGLKKNILPSLLDALNVGDFARAIGLISKDKDNAGLSQKESEELFRLIELDIQNTSNARDMQKTALNQKDLFSKRFVYYLASFWSIVGAVYIFLTTFFDIVNPRVADTVLGFLLGTLIATIINFFFGSSQGSKDKDLRTIIK